MKFRDFYKESKREEFKPTEDIKQGTKEGRKKKTTGRLKPLGRWSA